MEAVFGPGPWQLDEEQHAQIILAMKVCWDKNDDIFDDILEAMKKYGKIEIWVNY